ncbi:LysR substrate-binding domain-containing protein [Herbaspirillum robiniae]|uniref:LysR family transcriptional regulator n=1 Tax=Herbaspirillum robiniae TaxID=2014887 RepID=A0ABX2LYV4_9BURK|nr:LysR substrate-binding domain-containing protein [Herbaspirillum robiniae]NUU03664.1 LysR family transcriptional regulator [Herbaspirillum robiniae]
MTLDQLRAFVAVVEHGSIRAAARALDMGQSGLTQQIQRLEASLACTLFVRGHSGIGLTAHGSALLARARVILGEYERALQECSAADGELAGAVNVGVSSEAFAKLVPPVLRQLRECHPRVTVHLASGPSSLMLSGIREGRIDFALSLVSPGTDMLDLAETELLPADPCIIGRRGHPLQDATSIRQLAGAAWINTRPIGVAGTPGNRIADWFAASDLAPPHIVATVESLFDTLQLVAQSDYLFLGPRAALAPDGFGQRLTSIAVAEPIPAARISLIQRAAAPLGPAARELAAMLVSYARMAR